MGHIHLPQLPRTRAWREVVVLLDRGASDDALIAEAATAAEKKMQRSTDDPDFVEWSRQMLEFRLDGESGR